MTARNHTLTVTEHLEELRRRLAISLGAVVVATCLSFWLSGRLVSWLKRPAGDLLPTLAFFSPTEAIVAYMKVAVVFGVVLSMPVMLYQVWAFVRSGLLEGERRYGLAFILGGSALFLCGGWLAYAVLLPAFLRFLLTFGGPDVRPVISISPYLSFVLGMMIATGLLCELPLVIMVLVRIGVLTPQSLRRRRGLAIVIIMVVAAFVTPTTDAMSLLMLAVPLLLLYELSILLSGLVAKRPSS